MFNKKEKEVKKYLLNDEVEFTRNDKEDILNNIKSKLNLESQEEKPSLKQSFNLKVVYALVCSVVICVLGFVGYDLISKYTYIDPDYRGKNVESLNLAEGDYCLAFSNEFTKIQADYIYNKYCYSIEYKINMRNYIVIKNDIYYLVVDNGQINEYQLIIKENVLFKYKEKFDISFSINELNDDN